jgi:alanine racemase
MIQLDHFLEATRGQLLTKGKQQTFDAFNHDTRQLIPGEMFVAVRGERSNGHDYLLDALQRGAAALCLENSYLEASDSVIRDRISQAEITTVLVPDTRLALQQYASFILRLWQPTVIAITGSTGKTSTKEAIARVLGNNFATFRSWQNYNDLLGLPLSLGRLQERHEFAVLELACDHPNEIIQLCQILQPTIGILTNISPAHLKYFESLDHFANELGSLLTNLPANGFALFNQDDPLIRELHLPIQARQLPYSPATVSNLTMGWEGLSFNLQSEESTLRLSSHLIGAHHVSTMLAAYALGKLCGIETDELQHSLAQIEPLSGRLNPLSGCYGSRLLDDTHNATPASMLAGLQALKELPASQRIAILGDMLRLGSFEEEAHHQVGQAAAQSVDYLITRGEKAALIADSARQNGLLPEQVIVTSTHEDAARATRQILEHSQHNQPISVLIKGSEETRMEWVTERLLQKPASAPEVLVRQTPGWKQIVVMRAERPTWLEIDLSAIGNNTRCIKELVGENVQVLASLKADGYGHGALKVARTVLHNGATMLGVATVSEATPLREAGITAPILVFGYVPLWQMREAVRQDLTVTLYASESAHALSRAAQALQKTVKVHVKVDTGMARLGIRFEEINDLLALLREIKQLPGLELEGIFTHFAKADSSDKEHVQLQLARFKHVLEIVEAHGLRPPIAHAANSAATLSLPEAHFQMVRPGIALYGLDPSEDVRVPANFRAALSFKTQIAQVKMIPEGEYISYGCTYQTDRPTRIAVIPVGYADGFRRTPNNWGSVLVHGETAPIRGRVCMDQCMIDVTHLPQARMGDEVVLIGQQGNATLTAEMVAQRLGTISYEVVSEILARVPRID